MLHEADGPEPKALATLDREIAAELIDAGLAEPHLLATRGGADDLVTHLVFAAASVPVTVALRAGLEAALRWLARRLQADSAADRLTVTVERVRSGRVIASTEVSLDDSTDVDDLVLMIKRTETSTE